MRNIEQSIRLHFLFLERQYLLEAHNAEADSKWKYPIVIGMGYEHEKSKRIDLIQN